MKKVLLIHGPNLNLTGQREPGIYGSNTLASINAEVVQKCERLGMECAVFQSNSEGALIDRIHAAREDCDAIIMNAGAALLSVLLPATRKMTGILISGSSWPPHGQKSREPRLWLTKRWIISALLCGRFTERRRSDG